VNRRPRPGGQGSWLLSVLLHLGVVGAIVGTWYWVAHRPHPVQSMGIEARVVSGDALHDTASAPQPVPEPEPAPVIEEPAQEVPAETPPPDPGPTPEQVAAQAAQAEQSRVAEERRVAAERKEADRKAAAQKAERERKEKERMEKERVAKEKAEKEKAEKAERERLAQEKIEKERTEKARQQREDELTAQLAAEDKRAAARSTAAMAQYAGQIANRIERNWIRPPSVKAGLECELRVTQVPGGAVTGVKLGRCNADEAVRQSIEAAVYRASPLPSPPDPALFERDLVVTFRPD
jgi:colicin import membrane protein